MDNCIALARGGVTGQQGKFAALDAFEQPVALERQHADAGLPGVGRDVLSERQMRNRLGLHLHRSLVVESSWPGNHAPDVVYQLRPELLEFRRVFEEEHDVWSSLLARKHRQFDGSLAGVAIEYTRQPPLVDQERAVLDVLNRLHQSDVSSRIAQGLIVADRLRYAAAQVVEHATLRLCREQVNEILHDVLSLFGQRSHQNSCM